MTIGQLASEAKTDSQTIRFYEREGLLAEPERSEGNYRIYAKDAVVRLTFIRRAKEIGFSLNDIKVLLSMADGRVCKCVEVQLFAETRLTKIHSQIADLQAMERTLTSLVRQCAQADNLKACPIIETLTESS